MVKKEATIGGPTHVLIIQDVLRFNLFLTKIDISAKNGKGKKGGGKIYLHINFKKYQIMEIINML